jgi:polyhydroxyalkanoate synthesis regulator protein
MAKDAWSRFREKEEERLEEEKKKLQEQMKSINPDADLGKATSADQILVELLNRCEVMMDQITNLYQMWVQGLERTPPISQRKNLEDLVLKIQAVPRPSTNLKFRVTQFQTKYSTFKDKWDRLLKDVESGKITPKRRGS